MNFEVFINLNPHLATLTLDGIDLFIKSLDQQKEMAASTNKLDWQSELITSINHCETIKSCLYLFRLKKDIEDKKPGASQLGIGVIELEARLVSRGLNTETLYKNWKETGKFL